MGNDVARVCVLGPITVVGSEGPVDLGGSRQRRLLAALVVDAGRVVPTERLAERVWSDSQLPEDPRRAVRTGIARLRRVLGEQAVLTDAAGYRLDLSCVDLDCRRFDKLIETADEAGLRRGPACRSSRGGIGALARRSVRRGGGRGLGAGRGHQARRGTCGGDGTPIRRAARRRPPHGRRPTSGRRRRGLPSPRPAGGVRDAGAVPLWAAGRSEPGVPGVPGPAGSRPGSGSGRRPGRTRSPDRRGRPVAQGRSPEDHAIVAAATSSASSWARVPLLSCSAARNRPLVGTWR